MKKPLLLVATTLFTLAAHSQKKPAQPVAPVDLPTTDTAPEPSPRFPARWYPAESTSGNTIPRPVKGAPYTATLVTSGRYVNQATGKVTNQEVKVQQARDTAGRVRHETPRPRKGPDGREVEAHEVEVVDVVSHCTFRWEEPWLIDPKINPTPTAGVACKALEANLQDYDIYKKLVDEPEGGTEEKGIVHHLPAKKISGVQASGIRQTRLIPGQTSSVQTEIWYSQDLHEMISFKMNMVGADDSKPFGMPADYALTDIKRKEPDPKLFYPPANYKIESDIEARERIKAATPANQKFTRPATPAKP